MLSRALRRSVILYRQTLPGIYMINQPNTNLQTYNVLRTPNFTIQRCYSQQNQGFVDLFDPQGRIKEPPPNIDYFSLFGLEKSFALDTTDLAKVYKILQRQLHPDRFSLKHQEEKDISEKWSALVNNGYNWLLKPLPRALYLLELLGLPLEEGAISVNTEFLMQMMELNEELLEARSDKSEITRLGAEIRKSLQAYIENIEDAFKKGDIETARAEVAHMKYYANILDKIIEIEMIHNI